MLWWLCCSQERYKQAKLSLSDRGSQVATVVSSLEEDLQLLCVTGVEDQLQVCVCVCMYVCVCVCVCVCVKYT